LTSISNPGLILTSHLIKHGFQRIGGVFGAGSSTGSLRHEGFVRALKDHNIKPANDLIKFANPREEDGFNTAMKLLEMQDRPDALLTSNRLLAQAFFLRSVKADWQSPMILLLPVSIILPVLNYLNQRLRLLNSPPMKLAALPLNFSARGFRIPRDQIVRLF